MAKGVLQIKVRNLRRGGYPEYPGGRNLITGPLKRGETSEGEVTAGDWSERGSAAGSEDGGGGHSQGKGVASAR